MEYLRLFRRTVVFTRIQWYTGILLASLNDLIKLNIRKTK